MATAPVDDWRDWPPEQKRRLLHRLRAELQWKWEDHARPNQLAPSGDWFVWLILAGRGWGKALDLTTPLPTPAGWTTMGEVNDGDWLLDEQGRPCQVVKAHDVLHGRECFAVRFDDGSRIVADGDHLWETWDKRARKSHGRARAPGCHPEVRTTRQIAATLRVQNGREVNHSVRVAAALELPPRLLPIDPYVLGVWLGDGTARDATITIGEGDEEIVQQVVAAGVTMDRTAQRHRAPLYAMGKRPAVRGEGGRMYSDGSFYAKLRALGVMNNKHVPAAYLRGSRAQRLALLQGLMDSDGCADRESGCVEFANTTRALADAVLELAVSLGEKATLGVKRATLYGRDCGEAYRVCWRPHEIPFRLARKRARVHPAGQQATRTTHRYIVAVEPVSSVPVRCVTVDSPSRLYLAGRAMIPTHNTRTGAEWAAAKARKYPGVRIALVAATFSDGRDTMVEGESGLLSVIPDHELRGGTRDTAWNRSMGELFMANGSRFKVFSSEKPGRLRGPQHHFAWGDEPLEWEDAQDGPELDTTWSNLEIGCRLAVDDSEPQIVLTSTPKPFLLLTKRDAKPLGLLHRDGVVLTRGHTDENIHNLARTYRERIIEPLRGTRISRQELAGEILEDVEGALWKKAWIDAHRTVLEPIEYRAKTVALDPSDGTAAGDEQAICVAGLGLDNDFYVIASEGHRDASVMQWIVRALELCREHSAKLVWERNHGGAALRELIQMAMAQTGIRAPIREVWASEGKKTRAGPVAQLYEGGAVRTRGRVRHLGEFTKLEDQMTTWTGQGKSPDRMDALVWAMTDLMGYGAPPGFGEAPGEQSNGVAKYSDASPGVVRWK